MRRGEDSGTDESASTTNCARRPNVLVVDDEAPLADLYARWLGDEYAVQTAEDGVTALAEMDDDVDVLLLDRRMPDISGDEVLETVRDRGYDCRVVMLTAVEPTLDVVEMPFDDYLTKPVSRFELTEIVAEMVALGSYDQQVRAYAAASAKHATLKTHLSRERLAESDEFLELKRRIARTKAAADESLEEFGEYEDPRLWSDVARH
jgi:DNA-binding response OmpR family regulator